MKNYSKISTALRRMAEGLKDDTVPIDSIYLIAVDTNGASRFIPYDCETKGFDNSPKTVYNLARGVLREGEAFGLAAELQYVREESPEDFDELIEMLIDMEYENMELVEKILEDISKISNGDTEDEDEVQSQIVQ